MYSNECALTAVKAAYRHDPVCLVSCCGAWAYFAH